VAKGYYYSHITLGACSVEANLSKHVGNTWSIHENRIIYENRVIYENRITYENRIMTTESMKTE